jgi:hypothetical protein
VTSALVEDGKASPAILAFASGQTSNADPIIQELMARAGDNQSLTLLTEALAESPSISPEVRNGALSLVVRYVISSGLLEAANEREHVGVRWWWRVSRKPVDSLELFIEAVGRLLSSADGPRLLSALNVSSLVSQKQLATLSRLYVCEFTVPDELS